MESSTAKKPGERVAKYADMFSRWGRTAAADYAIALVAHPEGLVVGDIQGELGDSEFDPFASSGQIEE